MLFLASYMLYNASHDASFADDYIFTWTEIETGSLIDTGIIVDTGLLTDTGVVIDTWVIIDTWVVIDTGVVVETETGSLIDTGAIVDTGSLIDYWFQTQFTGCDYSGFSSNISWWKTYSWIINVFWAISPNCENDSIDIQLYDHNEEWITLATVSWTTTQYIFDTKLLWSWFYLQTWLDSSGQAITIIPAIYSWVSANSWSWYRLRWFLQPDMIISETTTFSIDNQIPKISNISLGYSWSLSGIAGIWSYAKLRFDSSERLTWVRVKIGSSDAVFVWLSGLNYFYDANLLENTPSWYIGYSISYQDVAGHTGYVTGLSNLLYDSIYPQLTWFNLSWYDFSFVTSKYTVATAFVLIRNTTDGRIFSMTGSSTWHKFSLPTLSLNTDYDMWIVVKDAVWNEWKAALGMRRNSSGDISFKLLATLYGQVLTNYSSWTNFLSNTWINQNTGQQQELIVEKFKQEINKFTECKNNIEYTKIKLQIKWVEIQLNMPMFQKNEIKKLVNSFVLYILKNLEKAPLSEEQLNDIAQNFDWFSVILKLLKDDNNLCKQNLSNYHLEQFKQSLDTYGISL